MPSHPSLPSPSSSSTMLRCYWCDKIGNTFQTKIVEEYEKHGTLRHPNKSLYPNMVTIKENGLNPQGREWET